jgi:hypothetical protein
VLEFLWDVSKAFDSVDHGKLEAALRDLGYPVLILKISLLSYTWVRVLVVEQVCSTDIYPTGGVGPGSAYAIFELAGYMVDDLEAVLGKYGSELALNVHVDDVAARVVHEDKLKALEVFIGAGAMLVHSLEKDKGLKFAPSKANILANDEGLLKEAVRLMGVRAGDKSGEVRRLGYDYTVAAAGIKPCKGKVFVLRMHKHKRRVKRIMMLKTKRSRPAKVYYAGALPGLLFGAELWGIDGRTKNQMRAEALRVHGLCTRGISNKLVWGLVPTKMDPAVKADLMPIERYCKELWSPEGEAKVTLSDDDLKEAYTVAMKEKKGPIWAASKAMGEAEWVHVDWDTVRLRDGKEVNLKDVSPGLIKKFYQRDVQDRSYDDWWFEQSMKDQTRRGKPDKVVLKEMLAEKKRPRREQLAALRGFAGTMPTKARMRKWGANITDSCEFCGDKDDWEHRMWKCTATEEIRGRNDDDLNELGRSGTTEQKLHGWFVPPKKCRQPQDLVITVYKDGEKVGEDCEWTWEEGKTVFFDGSCYFQRTKGYEVAGGAAIQVDERGRVTRGAIASVPAWLPQTSMSGEHIGIVLIGMGAEDGSTIRAAGDCQTVVKDCDKDVGQRAFWKKPYAGIWKGLKDRGVKLEIQKVAAHKPKSQAILEGWLGNWTGNDRVDHFAKIAAGRHMTSKEEMAVVVGQRELAKKLFKQMGLVSNFFQEKMEKADITWTRKEGNKRVKKQHTWEWDEDQEKFRCTSCLTSTKSLYGKQGKKKCVPLTPESRGHIRCFWANGHLLRAIKGRKGNQLMVFCGKCGRYASGKGDKLNQLCPGQPGRKATLTRLLEGRHPEKGYHLGEVTLLSVARSGANPFEESPREQGQATPKEPKEVAADPMHELEELEKALERYQTDFEEGPGRDGADDEDWELLSSGSE